MATQEVLQLLSRYLDAYEELKVALDQFPPEKLLLRPEPDKWCAREIVLHLLDSEIIVVERMKRIIVEDTPNIPAFDQAAFAGALGYTGLDMRPALLIIGLLREHMSEILEKIPDETWLRTGLHSERGPETLLEVVKRQVSHAETHIAQIITLKKKLLT